MGPQKSRELYRVGPGGSNRPFGALHHQFHGNRGPGARGCRTNLRRACPGPRASQTDLRYHDAFSERCMTLEQIRGLVNR